MWWEAWVRGHRRIATGRFEDVEQYLREVRALGERAGEPDASLPAVTHVMCVRMLQGRCAEAAAVCDEVLEQHPDAVPFQCFQAWVHAGCGRRDESRAILARLRVDDFGPVPHSYTRLALLTMLARATALVEDAVTAEALYTYLLPHRGAMSVVQSAWLGPITNDLGLLATVLGRYDEADDHFAAAVEFQERASTLATLVHTRLAWARMLMRRGRPEDVARARGQLEAAEAEARQVNIPLIEGDIDRLLTELGPSNRRDGG
jgi:tetratricopeptide (TPR) repeat protein